MACTHRSSGTSALRDVAYPRWVLQGTRPVAEGGVRSLVGVGQIDGMRNVALARATADNRARAELAHVLTTYIEALLAVLPAHQTVDHPPHAPGQGAKPPRAVDQAMQTAQAVALAAKGAGRSQAPAAGVRPELLANDTKAAPGPARDDPSHEATAKLLLAAALPSVQISDRWFHPERGAVFSLARLDLEEMRDGVARLHELSEDVQSALLAALDPIHSQLVAATAQPAQRG